MRQLTENDTDLTTPAVSGKSSFGPNDPPWNSLIAVGLWIFSVALILFVPLFFLLPYIFTRPERPADAQAIGELAANDPTAILIQVAAIIPAHLLTLLAAWIIVTKGRRYSFTKMLGTGWGGMRWWHFVVILAAFYGVAAVVGHYIPEKTNDMIKILSSSKAALYSVAFLAVVTAPITEEVVYRGVLYSAFQRSTGKVFGVLVVTALFALVHVPQYLGSLSTIILITLLSLVLTIVRMRTDNLLPAVVLHTIFNGLQSLGLLIEPPVAAPSTSPLEHASAFLHLF